MNRNLIIAGSVLVVAVVIYFVWKSKKKSPTTAANTPQGPQPGGAFAPKILTEQDFLQLETVFKENNPFNADLAKKIEGQGIDENEPLKLDGSQKVLLTKSQFDNLVLAKIRRLIGQRSSWVQDEENRRFEEWRGAVRAGYAQSLAQALAFAVRVDTATSNYYTGSTPAPGAPAPGQTDYKSILLANGVNSILSNLNYTESGIANIITATNGESRYFYDLNLKKFLTQTEAINRGISWAKLNTRTS